MLHQGSDHRQPPNARRFGLVGLCGVFHNRASLCEAKLGRRFQGKDEEIITNANLVQLFDRHCFKAPKVFRVAHRVRALNAGNLIFLCNCPCFAGRSSDERHYFAVFDRIEPVLPGLRIPDISMGSTDDNIQLRDVVHVGLLIELLEEVL